MFRSTENKGFQLTFANGWTISVQFGKGNYCNGNRDKSDNFNRTQSIVESVDAEIAI